MEMAEENAPHIGPPHVGLSLMLEAEFAACALPLFEAGDVDVIEWSFDTGWGAPIPAWADELIGFYSSQGRLLGHGVTFSALSGAWSQRQQEWLGRLQSEVAARNYSHISEHFGFSNAGSFHDSAPLPVPRTPEALRIGRDRLARLADVAQVPVGLENLAFAFGAADVREQGAFLEDLLAPGDGFLLLDLHNVYCQSFNFNTVFEEMLESYPLARVRELHVSGGSWSESESQPERGPIRRDTHDERVPEEVFELVSLALSRCPNVRAVIFERLGDTLSLEDAPSFAEDFRRLQVLVRGHSG
jgi:uncharacterized protein (UPF0276 family)